MTEDKGILIKNIFYMLSYAFQELRKNNYQEIAGEEFDGVHDLFAEILVRGVSAQLKQGLHRTYVSRRDELCTLRGKLNINGTVRVYAKGNRRLSCEYDEYSEDNIFNRILKSTILLLLGHSEVRPQRKKGLKKIIPFFLNVRATDLSGIKWNTLRFDRNSKTYQMLLYLCYFIIDNTLLSTDEGKVKMLTFSDEKMCRLYEKFVLEYYRRHHPEFHACARQISWNVVKEETTLEMLPILQTDIFLTIGERTLIIDTKYYSKSLQTNYDKRTIHSHNQNQILTYVLNHDREHTGNTDGILLYAMTEEEFHPHGQMKWHDGNMIYYRNLDLNQDFEGIKQQLELLVSNNCGQ
ncbi:MAG: 5-methylcytosine-specific restriction endonuclease system specificity protein McrC [Bacteroidales bacterium]|nr:5-methylcytosine-specific restriction endonuclease system specificity protein McrC [Bacteroidales bacterium]